MRFTHERLHGGASSEAPLLHVFHVDTLQEFSYNEHGGVVRSVLRHADAQTPQIVSGTAYQHNGNHILSQTDARGKTVTHDIDENTDLTRAVTDPNGQQVQYAYDSARRYEYAYNARGGVAWVRNNRLNTIARSDYDFGGRPRSMVTQDASGANVYTARVDYDTCGRLARFAEQVGASRAAYETAFGYDREDRPTALTYGSSASKTETAYDGLGRLSTRKVYVNGSAYTTAYAYAPGAESGQTTALVQEITQPGENHSYAYDNVGNIVSAARNGVTTTYAYDALGQLIRVNDPNDGTWTYEYDCGGNILNKKQYAYTTGTLGTVQQIVSYAYGDADWKDKLTRYNGVDIAYDAIGNPIHDGVWAYTWENGRQLRRMACDATIAEFVYNADGLRVQKTVNGVATNYTLHGKNIVHMTKGNAELHFWYDAQNRPAIVEFNGTKYGYLYNLQGDVIGLIDSANTEVVKYTYDAWGKPLSVTGSLANTIGYYNPFRYRGYVYDVETGLYYLRSRYYNPSWGRFVNADEITSEFITCRVDNCFAYCNDCPTMYVDKDGNLGGIFDLGQGWNWRIDPPSAGNGAQRHIHIWKNGVPRYSQNEDGSVHDGLFGDPPKWIQKKLRELKKWDWKNEKKETVTPAPSYTPTPAASFSPAPVPAPVAVPDFARKKKYLSNPQQSDAAEVFGLAGGIGALYLLIKIAASIPTGGLTLLLP